MRQSDRHGSAQQQPPKRLSQAIRDKNRFLEEKIHLEKRLGEKSKTISHLETNMRDLTASTAKQLASVRAEAKESDQLKDKLLVVGTKAVADLRIKLKAEQAENVSLTALLRNREESLVEIQNAWVSGAPEQTRAAVEAFSERSLSLVRNLKADLASVQDENRKLLGERMVLLDLRKKNTELRAKSEKDGASLQELRKGREEDKRSLRVAEEGKRAADERAMQARRIAEEQEVVIHKLLRENAKQFADLTPSEGCRMWMK